MVWQLARQAEALATAHGIPYWQLVTQIIVGRAEIGLHQATDSSTATSKITGVARDSEFRPAVAGQGKVR